MSGSKLVVAVTGSIAAYKACEVVSRLVQRGHEVRVIATESALRFVGAATWEGLVGKPPLSDLFAAGAALEHISLTRWADAVLVCPATANSINRLAAGLGDDLLGALHLARDRAKPFVLAPAMNPQMWTHPATEESVAQLRSWGVLILEPGSGRTACGESGEGRMREPDEIVVRFEAVLARPKIRRKVLVTSGGTAEPIDSVRVITNASSGRTGAGIAEAFARAGHEVTLLRARSSAEAPAGVQSESFTSFAELDRALQRLLSEASYDVLIHAAAVGDFSVASVAVGGRIQTPGLSKLGSDEAPVLTLKRNPKLIDQVRAASSNPHLKLVAFKLTAGAAKAAAQGAVAALFQSSHPDFVVHNDLALEGPSAFPADIYKSPGEIAVRCASRGELSEALVRLLA